MKAGRPTYVLLQYALKSVVPTGTFRLSCLPSVFRGGRVRGTNRPSGSHRVGSDNSGGLLCGCVECGSGHDASMVTQEDVPLLSILYFLLAHVVIRFYDIQEWIIAIGLFSLGLSLGIGKMSKQMGIHFDV